jgi:hypothetical protein
MMLRQPWRAQHQTKCNIVAYYGALPKEDTALPLFLSVLHKYYV